MENVLWYGQRAQLRVQRLDGIRGVDERRTPTGTRRIESRAPSARQLCAIAGYFMPHILCETSRAPTSAASARDNHPPPRHTCILPEQNPSNSISDDAVAHNLQKPRYNLKTLQPSHASNILAPHLSSLHAQPNIAPSSVHPNQISWPSAARQAHVITLCAQNLHRTLPNASKHQRSTISAYCHSATSSSTAQYHRINPHTSMP